MKEWTRQDTHATRHFFSPLSLLQPPHSPPKSQKLNSTAHLKQESEAADHTPDEDGQSGAATHFQGGGGAGTGGGGGRRRAGDTGEDGVGRLGGRSGGRSGRGDVHAGGVLGAAGVVGAAVAGARVGADAAVGDALVAELLADVEGQRQGVLGHVGLVAIAADAAVGERCRVTRVHLDGVGGDLLADDGARVRLVLAPALPCGQRNTAGVDNVVGVGGGDECRGHREEGALEGRHFILCVYVCCEVYVLDWKAFEGDKDDSKRLSSCEAAKVLQ